MSGRILFIFSTKALIYTAIGVGIGLIFYILFKMINVTIVGIVILCIFGLIGFIIGTFKMPKIDSFKVTRKTGGENIDDVVKRAILFKKKNNKIYLYAREERNNGNQ